MKANHIIVVPETHWDREWYVPFQEYRARLVLMMDKLLKILRENPDYKNFTFDGQTIPIEDYIEVRPQREKEVQKYVQQNRLSIGPMYILPDEFLISGESMIRNLLIGHQIAKRFGRVMKAGYIPDPFGHIAQLPQILSGFEIPSVLFARGFGDEFENENLNMEFTWDAPGSAASILAIHLVGGYGSIAEIEISLTDGIYKGALRRMKRVISKLEKYTSTPIVLLNSGSDHHEARPEIPEIIKQWNERNPEVFMEQNDFEYYVKKVLETNPKLKPFQGELRGGRYQNLLSGVFSARIWIKQRNTSIEYLYEKYAEPASTMAWILDNNGEFTFPDAYLLTGLKWLIKNHPHDSICGCSIDEVHDEMKTRFDWSEQIGNEIFKDSMVFLADMIKVKENDGRKMKVLVYNPLPWKRTDIVNFFIGTTHNENVSVYPDDLQIVDSNGNQVEYQSKKVPIPSRIRRELMDGYNFSFLAEMPACGYKLFYIIPNEKSDDFHISTDKFNLSENSLENEYYRISVDTHGYITCLDKTTKILHENICEFEDVGDWGDEYDYSGPKESQKDKKYTTGNATDVNISKYIDGPSQKTLKISMNLELPKSLSPKRDNRLKEFKVNRINVFITLYKTMKRVDFSFEIDNNSKDHRIRVLFPSKLIADEIFADGHFHIIPRKIELPEGKRWAQKPLGTNHQKDFIALFANSACFGILNKGLPEYEGIRNSDGTITIAITLLRCVEWLSRADFATRRGNAGPDFHTPGAQCLGKHEFELSLVTQSDCLTLLDSEIHVKGKEFNNPLKLVSPFGVKTLLRISDKLIIFPGIELVLNSTWFSDYKKEQYLPTELSFIELDNKKVMLSAVKKSEIGDDLIIRLYNISTSNEKAILTIYEGIKIKSSEIVNLLEETPKNQIKAKLTKLDDNTLEVILEPHVIATIKMKLN